MAPFNIRSFNEDCNKAYTFFSFGMHDLEKKFLSIVVEKESTGKLAILPLFE